MTDHSFHGSDCDVCRDAVLTIPSQRPEPAAENAVKADLTPRVRETSEFAAFARRVVRSYGRRVAAGDVEALPGMVELAQALDASIADAVQGLRVFGYSWAEIASRLGTTKQAAWQRWGQS